MWPNSILYCVTLGFMAVFAHRHRKAGRPMKHVESGTVPYSQNEAKIGPASAPAYSNQGDRSLLPITESAHCNALPVALHRVTDAERRGILRTKELKSSFARAFPALTLDKKPFVLPFFHEKVKRVRLTSAIEGLTVFHMHRRRPSHFSPPVIFHDQGPSTSCTAVAQSLLPVAFEASRNLRTFKPTKVPQPGMMTTQKAVKASRRRMPVTTDLKNDCADVLTDHTTA
nr:hypothetical protein CFP56_44405 [Quercus suber]